MKSKRAVKSTAGWDQIAKLAPAHHSKLTIQIRNQQEHLALDRRLVRRAVTNVLRTAGIKNASISVAVVDDETIARLNWDHLRHRGPADVLSFRLDDGDELDGEIVIGAETAIRSAPRYGWTAQEELLLYVVHGMLHLVGEDDRTPRQRAKMQQREREVLQALGIRRR